MSLPLPTLQAPSWYEEDARRFGDLVERRFGLHFPPGRQDELKRGVLRAFAASTAQDLDTFYRLAAAEAEAGQDTGLELDRLVNALTVGETYFFRDAGQFDALYHTVLPELIELRRASRTLRIWSAGCASGEEPYSIAMMLRVLLPDIDQWTITLLGTDINPEALARAGQALYGDWAFREERARLWRDRFFSPAAPPPDDEQGGRYAGRRWLLDPKVRRLATFQRLNLAGNYYPSFGTNTTHMDLILCRNVTIYFTPEVTQRLTEKLYAALAPGGWLVVGHSEASPVRCASFEPRNFVAAVLYRRAESQAFLTPQPSPQPRLAPEAPRATAPEAPRATGPEAPRASGLELSRPHRARPKRTASPVEQARETLEQAREMLEYGHSRQARALLEPVVAQAQALPQVAVAVLTLLGRAHANLGDLPAAELWCRRAIDADPLALEAYYTLALVLQHQGRMAEAIDALKKVVYIDRHSILGHFGLANLYQSQGQARAAQKALDNTRRLLEGKAPGDMIPGSGGITVGSLYEAVTRHQALEVAPGK